MLKFPDKKNLHVTNNYGDCSGYYYIPILSYFYIKRISMVLSVIKKQSGKVLDIGCGSGVLFYWLRKKFAHLYGLDLRQDLPKSKKMLEDQGIKVNLINGDMFRLPYKKASFDCIVSMSVLEHIADLQQPLEEIKRVLKEGGEFACGFPVKNFLMHQFFRLIGFDDKKDHPSDHRKIYELLKINFKIEKVIKFPYFLKSDHCFYIACRCKK